MASESGKSISRTIIVPMTTGKLREPRNLIVETPTLTLTSVLTDAVVVTIAGSSLHDEERQRREEDEKKEDFLAERHDLAREAAESILLQLAETQTLPSETFGGGSREGDRTRSRGRGNTRVTTASALEERSSSASDIDGYILRTWVTALPRQLRSRSRSLSFPFPKKTTPLRKWQTTTTTPPPALSLL